MLCYWEMIWAPKLSLSNIHVRLTAKGLLRIQLLSGCRKNTVVFQTGLSLKKKKKSRLCGVDLEFLMIQTKAASKAQFLLCFWNLFLAWMFTSWNRRFIFHFPQSLKRYPGRKHLLMLKCFNFRFFFTYFKHIWIVSVLYIINICTNFSSFKPLYFALKFDTKFFEPKLFQGYFRSWSGWAFLWK